MPWFRVGGFDSNGGSIGDLPPQSVPPNIFTDVRNVQLIDGAVEKAKGMGQQLGTPPISPYFLLSAQDNAANIKLFLASLTKIYGYASGVYTDHTRTTGGDYTAVGDNVWTGGVLHGIPFLNNGADAPQSWDSGTSKFVNLPNWTSGVTVKSLRAFRNFLVGLDVTKSGTRYPHNILWSHPADPGAVPSSWNTADATKDAGEAPLSETPGYIVDGMPLGNQFVVYKEDATYLMQFSGAPYIFNFRLALRESGVLARNCIVEVNGSHIVLTPDDVIMFNGSQAQSIINRKWRRALFSALAVDTYQKSFAVALPASHEVWFCVPTTSTYPPDMAYVWNWENNSWSKRDLPKLQSIVWALPPTPSGADWNSDSNDWQSDGDTWSAFLTRGKAVILASPTNTELYTLGASEKIDTDLMIAFAQHDSFDFATKESADTADVVKHITKLRPRIIAPEGTVLRFEIGTQLHINDPIAWGVAQYFTVGQQDELCMSVNGRYISWRIRSECDCTWRVEALDFLVSQGGRY